MANAPQPDPALDAALQRVASLLRSDPALAAREATAILGSRPGHPIAKLFLGMARRQSGDLPGALAILASLAQRQPGSAAAHYELGITLGHAGRRDEALAALERAVALKADVGEAWRLIAEHRMAAGDPAGADAAWANHVAITTAGPALLGAAAALIANRHADAERMLRAHLARHPDDPAALRMLAELAMRATRWEDAAALLERCLALAPEFAAARHSYALALHEQHRTDEALTQIEQLLAGEPGNPVYLNLKANALGRGGDHAGAIAAFEGVLADYPSNARIWMAYGDALKTAGRPDDGIAAYRRSLELAPGYGEAWWSLANLKTYRFAPEELAVMRARLGNADATDADRLHLHFALAKALEDEERFAESFAHYAEGNRIRRTGIAYDAAATSEFVRRMIALYSRQFVVQRAGWGCGAEDPIFVVGLPRSGSTLVEQILASHSAVEATMELPDVAVLARSLVGRTRYPDVLAQLDADACRALGERYLRQTRLHRRKGTPRFVDKMPNNWMHAGLIHLMLPNARIIDVRRDPMACCWSCFRQHFARGQHYTYSLEELGRFYRDYVTLMAHVDSVLPGRILRVSYERLVEDTETEVRRMLAHCGLDFEASTLRFHEGTRAVATASSEQVRRPVYREALEQWRHFEPWLGPLRDSLGPELAGERIAQ
jgi:tetratricopeptide (TPR) repeat protein